MSVLSCHIKSLEKALEGAVYFREPRGIGFLEYTDARDAEDARDALDRAVIHGREVQSEPTCTEWACTCDDWSSHSR